MEPVNTFQTELNELTTKLAFYIHESELSPTEQTALLDSLSDMGLEQIHELLEEKEAEYVNKQTLHLDKKLEEKLVGLSDKYTKEETQIDKRTVEELEDLIASL